MKEKTKKVNILLPIMCFIFVIIFFVIAFFFVRNFIGRQNFEKEISEFINKKDDNIFYIEKIVSYSSASATNAKEGKAMWDLNISQYTDIALFLGIQNENYSVAENENSMLVKRTNKSTITNVYIDNITYENNSNGTLCLEYKPLSSFAKVTQEELLKEKHATSRIDFEVTEEAQENSEKPYIDLNLQLPITLRYWNYQFKTNNIIMAENEPLTFNGSLLKRASIPLSTLKNKVSFTVHIVNALNENYTFNVNFEIPLQNQDNTKNIYDGGYQDEQIIEEFLHPQ